METPAAKITIHMVASLDGFIAKPDGSVSWMQPRDQYEWGRDLDDGEDRGLLTICRLLRAGFLHR
ncbi:MAG: hypothetical protein AAFZ63_24725 [Bacteroidota bacterium]